MPEHLSCGVGLAQRVCTPGRDNGGQTGSDYMPPPSRTAFVLQLPGPFTASRDTGLAPYPGSLNPVLEATTPVRSYCEFRRFCRVYALQGALVNEPGHSVCDHGFTTCLGLWRVLRCPRQSHAGRILGTDSRNRLDPPRASLAGYAAAIKGIIVLTGANPRSKEGPNVCAYVSDRRTCPRTGGRMR